MISIRKEITIEDKYSPAMEIRDPKIAREYFEACVRHRMSFDCSREDAERMERESLGYFAGYYDQETRLRVEELFDCAHPVFGKAKDRTWSPEEAFDAGAEWARRRKL